MFFKKACCEICRVKDLKKNLKISSYGMFDYRIMVYFHFDCLKKVIKNPENYDSQTIDFALTLLEVLIDKDNNRKNKMKKGVKD